MSPKPYYEDDYVSLYHGDALEIAPSLDYDAVVSDPPYGMSADLDSRRFSGGQRSDSDGRDWGAMNGDERDFDPRPWLDVEHVVLWGYHHFARRLPLGSVLVWIKKRDDLFGTFLSDCELAWRKGGHGVYAHRKSFPPPARMAETGTDRCVHPTQKPMSLMRWSIEMSGAPSDAVLLDPYAGSGTTLRVAKDMGRRAIGIEIEERYCEVAAKRLSQGVLALEDTA